ncbi:MAG: NUDIX hydrolase [Chloroflexota bacterium]|nr:NUDIX hydrolase [Chloroflexota bacterium]
MYSIAVQMQQSEDRYCPRCGAPVELQLREGRQRPVCTLCGWVIWHDPKLVASGVVAQDGRVLMVRRAMDPGRGLWCLPGGYVDRGEVVEAAVARELREETGLEVRVRRLVGLFSQPGRLVVLAVYDVEPVGGTLQVGPELLDVRFFPLDSLPELAFPWDVDVLTAWRRNSSSGPADERA